MLAFVNLETGVPTGHPRRVIKVLPDDALRELSLAFDGMWRKNQQPVQRH